MALLHVSQAGYYQSIKLLVTQGADVNTMNNDGGTVLHMILCSSKYKKSGAELFKPVKSVKHLLSVGAKINMADINGLTA